MNKFEAYGLVIASGVVVMMLGIFLLTYCRIGGYYPMMLVISGAIFTSICVYHKCSGVFKKPSSRELRKYPLRVEQFPIDELFIGDTVKLSDGKSYRYTGYFKGKYGFEGSQYIELTIQDIFDKIIELRNNRIIKWQRR